MPNVAVALDSQTSIHSLHDKVDAVSMDLELRNHAVLSTGDTQVYVDFEPALEWVRRTHPPAISLERDALQVGYGESSNTRIRHLGIQTVFKQFVSHALRAEIR